MSRNPHDVCRELAELWPRLDDALERAQGVHSGERVSGGSGASSSALPVDIDAFRDVNRLTDDICALALDVQTYLGEKTAHRGVLGHLRHFPRQYDRLRGRDAFEQSSYLAGRLLTWLGDVRRLVGLSVRDRRLGESCPLHDDPLTELVAPGDQGQLVERFVELDGQTVRSAAVDWVRVDVVTCRHCGAVWTPGPQYLALVRLLDQADQRRSDPGEADAA
jgi:hypothetical protein